MGLFGGKPDVEIQLDSDTVVAGGTVRARATFGAPDRKTQGARIELLYRNTYKHDTTDSDGDRTTSTTHSDVIVVVQQVDLSDSGLTGGVEAVFDVPREAPGTAFKSVEWKVRAVVDRKLARDARAEAPLTVLVPADQHPMWATGPLECSEAWPMSIEPSSRVVRPGETITGRFTFAPSETVKASGVRVQLRRHRSDPDANSDIDDKTRVELMGKTELPAGQYQDLSFSITVPPDAAPSFDAQYNTQRWYLEGVIDKSLARDPNVKAEVFVYTG